MDTRLKMTSSEFKDIGPYEDISYMTFNYEETLFIHLRAKLLNLDSSTDTYKHLTKGQKILWGYISLSSQIRNGGVAQYYWNTDGEYLQDIELVLNTINDDAFSKLFNNTKEIFFKNKQLLLNYKTLDAHQSQKTGQENKINYYELWTETIKGDEVDKHFFKNTKAIEKIVYDYVIANAKEFIK